MKTVKNLTFLLLTVLTVGHLSSCVSEDNKISGYGWGTVELDDFIPYVIMDGSKDFFVKGNELTSKNPAEGQRVFVTFTIDYDNQPPMSGNVKANFAKFTDITPFSTNSIEPDGSASFNDQMYQMNTPWITYEPNSSYSPGLITFNTAIFYNDKANYEFKLTFAPNYNAASDTAKFVLSYNKGTDENLNLQSVFHSYYLPSDLKEKCTIQVKFNATTTGNFGMTKDSTVCISYDKKKPYERK